MIRDGKNNSNYNHGHCTNGYSNLYYVWSAMVQRTTNTNNKQFKEYGGRGITVCKEWLKFENFLRDMGEPAIGMTLDRRDNQKGYYKENCRWISNQENCQNKSNNILNPDLVRKIRKLSAMGMKTRHIAKFFGIKEHPCYQLLAGKTWNNIT